MSNKDNEIQTYDGDKLKISGQSMEDYVKWREGMIRQIGEELASNLPMFYGKVEFNIQNGKYLNANMKIGIK